MFEKVLISAPTASAKNYCFKSWLENVMSFKYPDFDILLCDNTPDMGENTAYLNNAFVSMYGKSKRFLAIHSKIAGINSVIERMAISHNECRDTVLKGEYKYLLHLETDVFPEPDIIERLMMHRKQVIGALYYRDQGRYRKLCIQKHIYRTPRNIYSRNLDPGEDVYFIDGSLKRVASIGLGAVLIERFVLQKIPFRFIAGHDSHPDSFFSEDCFRNKIDIFADTACIARHDNQAWGIHGVDFY